MSKSPAGGLLELVEQHGRVPARILRLDMSEFGGHGAARRLLLQRDGQPSELIRKVRRSATIILAGPPSRIQTTNGVTVRWETDPARRLGA